MNAPGENLDLAPFSASKTAGILALAGVLSSVEAKAATVVDASFPPTITTVSADPNMDEVTPSALGGDVYVTVYPDWDESIVANSGIHKVYSPSSHLSLPGLEGYVFVAPLSSQALLGARQDDWRGLDALDYDTTTSSWAVSQYVEPFDVLGTDFSDSHPGFARTPNGDVIVGAHVQRGPDSIQIHEGGVARELITTDTLGGFALDIDRREMYFGDYSDLENPSIWVSSIDAWAPRLVVQGAFEPYFDATTQKLYFSVDVDPTAATNYDIFSIQKLPEEVPAITPISIEGQDGTDLSSRAAEIDCTEVPTYTVTVAVDGVVASGEGLALVEGANSTPLVGRIVDGKLVVDVPTAGMPMNAECNVVGTAVREDGGRAPFSVTLVAVPECEVSLDHQETTTLDTAPETGEVVIDGDAGTLAYTVDFLAKFADGEVTADVQGAGSIVYGVDESGRSFLRSGDGIKRFLSGTDAAMVKFAPTEGSVTIKDADGNVLVVLNAGEEAVVSIDYVTPEEVDTPETDTPDDTVDTTPEEEDKKGAGCDVTGENPKDLRGRIGAMLLAAAGLLRRRPKN